MRRTWCFVLQALLLFCATASYAQEELPPPPDGGKLRLRILVNEDTKPFAVAAVGDPETRAKVSDIADYVLGQVGELTAWQYELPECDAQDPSQASEQYRRWAAERGLRPFGYYRMLHDPEEDGTEIPAGLVELHYRAGEDGGLLGTMADGDEMTVIWASGDIALGALVGTWLGLPSLPTDLPSLTIEDDQIALPELPTDIPLDSATIRLDLTARELHPLADELAARANATDELEGEIDSDMLMILRKGAAALEPVRGLTVLIFPTPTEADVSAVVAPAAEWASAQGWGSILQFGEGEGKAELFARFGADGGAMVIGRRGDDTAILVTEGCPDLMAILAP